MKKFIACMFICSMAWGCGAPVEDTSNQPSKEEIAAQGKADHGTDWCAVLDWYGDGVCDTFCLNPDPDCDGDIDCKAAFVVPACDDGELLVDELTCEAAGDSCRVGELCGVVSHCLFVGEFCPQVVGTPAECPANHKEVETCETSECVVTRGTGDKCTQVKFCEPDIDCTVAFVVPHCESGELLVDEMTCLAAGDDCETSTLCGVDSHCIFVGEVCPQVVGTPAACPAGTKEVDTCSSLDCTIERGTGDQCTDIVFCEPEIQCLAFPSCAPGEINISTQQCSLTNACRSVTMCGETLHCWEFPKFCPQVVGTPPSCGANQTEVSGCTTAELDAGTCEAVSGSGDKCADWIYCRD